MNDKPSANRIIGIRMRKWRRRCRLTQQRLADTLSLHREAIAELEAGRRKLTFVEADLLRLRHGLPFRTLCTALHDKTP